MADRFWSKVDTTGDCWTWTAATQRQGYGKFADGDGGWELAHRVAWRREHGSDADEQVNHHCDNPCCVNPDHLYQGDQSENMKDAVSRNRIDNTGSDNANAMLSEDDVRDIKRRLGESYQDLADEYDVSYSAISAIANGQNWSDIEP